MRIAIVLGRYGPSVIGGAETLGAGLASTAAANGWDVEIWTTCAVDSATWANQLPAGISVDRGITVRRFEVDPWDAVDFHELNHKLIIRGGLLESDKQYDWVQSGPHSSELNMYVKREARKFDALVIMPYLSSIVFDAAMLAKENVILWPCLHDELYAYLEPSRLLLESVNGVVFISPEEMRFALEELQLTLARSCVIGSGVALDARGDQDRAVEFAEPYLLYTGRLEHGKNVLLLYDFVRRYAQEGGTVKLVVAGDGPCLPPEGPEFHYVGVVSEQEKEKLMANALATCQPSNNESFSLVIMESWLKGRPVLVSADCDVTRGHVQRSKGGLWFRSYNEFVATVEWLLVHEEEANRMGRNGQSYVNRNFSWEHVFNQFKRVLVEWKPGG